MNKEEFLDKLVLNCELVPKRCTESFLVKNNLMEFLDASVPKEFGSVSDRIKHLRYGGGYCGVCGKRTALSSVSYGFKAYCSEHSNESKKGKPAHNKKQIPPKEELEDLYFKQNMTLLDISKHYGNVSNVTVKKWFEQYNIETISLSKTIKLKVMPKIVETCKDRYGSEHYFSSIEGRKKIADSFIKKYGVPYHPIENPSRAEEDVRAFFNSICDGFEKDVATIGMELDGYNPKIKVAFEYHGLFWHTDDRKPKALHYQKYKKCEAAGIRLFSIFSNEWIERNAQVKNFILASLGKHTDLVYARELNFEIRQKKDTDVIKFLDSNHIQGSSNFLTTKAHYCLTDENGIASVISIGPHPRHSNVSCITRMATRPGLKIVGGSKRLLHHALKDFDSLTTWSDNRWTNGDAYARLGFSLVSESRQDYYYTDGRELIHKQKMSKNKIGAPDDITEHEYVKQTFGLLRIWDCGKKTWKIERQ